MGCPKFTPKTASSLRRLPPHLIHPYRARPHSPPQTTSGFNQPFCHSSRLRSDRWGTRMFCTISVPLAMLMESDALIIKFTSQIEQFRASYQSSMTFSPLCRVACTHLGVNFLRKVGGSYGERGERAYNGGLRQSPSGVQGQSPWSEGASEAEDILSSRSANEAQICAFLVCCKLLKYIVFEKILLHFCLKSFYWSYTAINWRDGAESREV